MYLMCKKYKLQVSESSFSKTLKITLKTEGYFSMMAKLIPIWKFFHVIAEFAIWKSSKSWNHYDLLKINTFFISNEYFWNLTFSYKPYLTILHPQTSVSSLKDSIVWLKKLSCCHQSVHFTELAYSPGERVNYFRPSARVHNQY